MVYDLSQHGGVFNTFVAELRDERIQQGPMRFRRNLERIGEVVAYELSKKLAMEDKMVPAPLGRKEMRVRREQALVAAILRAGWPRQQGVLSYFDRSDLAFISAYRNHKSAEDDDI